MFKDELEQAIKNSGMTISKISELSGVPTQRISDYRHGVNPSKVNLEKLKQVLDIKPIPLTAHETEKTKLEQAAHKLGMGVESLKEALIQDKFDPQIGFALKTGSDRIPEDRKRWRYIIFDGRLEKYVKGEL